MGHIELNTSDIKLCLGAAEVSAAYLGDEKVYPNKLPNYFAIELKNTADITLSFEWSVSAVTPHSLDLEFSYDCKTWYIFDPTDTKSTNEIGNSEIAVNTIPLSTNGNFGRKVYIRGNNNFINNNTSRYYHFVSSSAADFKISGNIMSLLNAYSFEELNTVNSMCFAHLFDGFTNCDAEDLLLPAQNLGTFAYNAMFVRSKIYKTPSVLPATNVSDYSYNSMFLQCSLITTTPEILAKTIGEGACQNMFNGCTGLTSTRDFAPTTLSNDSCAYMFNGCTNLLTAMESLPVKNIPARACQYMFKGCSKLTATPFVGEDEYTLGTVGDYGCYCMFRDCTALQTTQDMLWFRTISTYGYSNMYYNCTSLTKSPDLYMNSVGTNGCSFMFNGCTSLTTSPAGLPPTTLASSCYLSMFKDCTSLMMAPILPAETLADGCYNNMFNGCTSLNYIKAMFLTTPSITYTSGWTQGVSANGIFVKNEDAVWNVTGSNGIPSGWTVRTASA